MSKLKLKLYVTGGFDSSEFAVRNTRQICDEQFSGEYELKIVNVLEKSQLENGEKILATPTLVKEFPLPLRRITGDLSQAEKILSGLGLKKYIKSSEDNNL